MRACRGQPTSTAKAMIAAGHARTWSVTIHGARHFDSTDHAAYRFAFPLRLLSLGFARPRPSS